MEAMQSEIKLLMIIIDRDYTAKLEEILREKHAHIHYMFNAMGTARSEILKPLGLSGTEKTVCVCLTPAPNADSLMKSVADRMSLTKPGNGIVYTLPVSGISSAAADIFKNVEIQERVENYMELSTKNQIGDCDYSLVIAVINQGFSETLMSEARSVGARGGTIIHARRSAVDDAVKFFGVTLQKEKEIVTILVPQEQKRELMRVITAKCGLNTEARGIIVSLPVESCSGLEQTKAEE